MNTLNPVAHNIDTGVITSDKNQYWIEPKASYTINDVMNYFYSKNIADKDEYYPARLKGILIRYINKYGIDLVMFMIEHAYRVFISENKQFSIQTFESYKNPALNYLKEIENNCKYTGSDKYVPRKRMLFA